MSKDRLGYIFFVAPVVISTLLRLTPCFQYSQWFHSVTRLVKCPLPSLSQLCTVTPRSMDWLLNVTCKGHTSLSSDSGLSCMRKETGRRLFEKKTATSPSQNNRYPSRCSNQELSEYEARMLNIQP